MWWCNFTRAGPANAPASTERLDLWLGKGQIKALLIFKNRSKGAKSHGLWPHYCVIRPYHDRHIAPDPPR